MRGAGTCEEPTGVAVEHHRPMSDAVTRDKRVNRPIFYCCKVWGNCCTGNVTATNAVNGGVNRAVDLGCKT